MTWVDVVTASTAPAAILLVRLMVGGVFLSEGVQDGFWKMAHEARTDYAMFLGSLLLLCLGAGPWPRDAWLTKRRFSRTR